MLKLTYLDLQVPGAPGGQISSVAESANEGEDEDANAPADLASIASHSRRATDDSAASRTGEREHLLPQLKDLCV